MLGFDYSVPHFVTHVRGTCIIVTPNIVSEVLHVPKVAHPDYPSYDHLKTVSKDQLSSQFCETPSSWGDRQNTPCSGFAKGPRFLNMVMTFILHPLSHYNSITEPRARFFYPFLRDFLLFSASTEVATNRDNGSSFFFRSFHIHTFFFSKWSDLQGDHGVA